MLQLESQEALPPQHPPIEVRSIRHTDHADASLNIVWSAEEIDLGDVIYKMRKEEVQQNIQYNEQSIRAELMRIVETIKDPAVTAKYNSPQISLMNLLGVLQHSSSDQNIKFVYWLTTLPQSEPEVQQFIAGKLDNVARYLSEDEKIRVVLEVLANSGPAHTVAAILSTAEDLAALVSLSESIGVDHLLANAELREIGLVAKLDPILRELSNIAPIDRKAEAADVDQALAELKLRIEKVVEVLRADRSMAETGYVQDHLRIADLELTALKAANGMTSHADRMQLHNLIAHKLTIELKYGVLLSYDSEPGAPRWREKDLIDIQQALEAIPERLFLFTPLLSEIRRVSEIAPDVLGVREPNGLICISDIAIDNTMVSIMYEGRDSLEVTLTHEIGHGVQIGDGKAFFVRQSDGSYILQQGDRQYEFDQYLLISGWELIQRSRYHVTNQGMSVVLDGVEYAVGVPIVHNGRDIILTWNFGMLYAYESHAGFSLVTYSRTNPWEDWAEGFSEYILSPERLIKFAPEKFKYFEAEFGKYQDDSSILELLKNLVV